MLVIINFIFALIFFFIFLIMLHLKPSFIKLAIALTTLLINIVCIVTIISSFKYTMIDIKYCCTKHLNQTDYRKE